MRTHYVTPRLYLGQPPKLGPWVQTDQPAVAVSVMLSGKIAVLPVDGWDLVDQVLVLLGVDAQSRRDRLTMLGTRDVPFIHDHSSESP